MWFNGLLLSLGLLICSFTYAQKTLVFSAVEGTFISDINEVIIRDAYKRLGIDIVIKRSPAARALQQSNSGIHDGELFRIANIHKKYPNLVMTPVVLYEVEVRVYSKNHDFKVQGWDSLSPYKIGIERGVQFSLQGTKGMRRQIFNSAPQLFKVLAKDRVDIVVADVWSALGAKHELYQTGFFLKGIRALSPKLMVIQLHHYLHNKHLALVPKVNQAIKEALKAGMAKKAEGQLLKQYALPKSGL